MFWKGSPGDQSSVLCIHALTLYVGTWSQEVAGLLEDIDLVSSLSEVAEKKGRSALALQRGLEGWRAAIENMPEHSVSLYAAACGCFMDSSAAQPEGLEQLAAALSKSYPAGQLVKPYAVCKLRRVLAAVGLSPWPDAAGGSASSSSCRLQDMLGAGLSAFSLFLARAFATTIDICICRGLGTSRFGDLFRTALALGHPSECDVTAGSSMGAPDDSILAKEAVQTLEDFAETLPIRCTWKVSAKDLAAGLVQPPFADSVKLTFVVLSCQQGSPADREVKQLEAFVEQLKRNLGQSMLEHVVAEDFTSITPSNRAVTHDFLRLIASSSKRPALGGPNGGQLLKSVLRAIWNLEFPRESFHFLVEAAGCLAPRTSSSASSGSNDGWLDIDEAAAALWNQDRCSNSSFIRELSERKQVPELILPSLCTAFASATKTKKWPAEGRQLCDVQVDVDLRLLAHCISEGLRAGAAWIELLDGKAGQIKELAKAAWSLTIDAEVPCELAQKLVQTKEGSIGAELAYLFEVVREKHRERLQIMEAVSSIPLKLRLHLLNLPIPTPPTTYPACACWSCWSADPQVVAFLKGLACLGDCSSLLRSCIQMAGNHNGSGSGDVQTFQQVLRSATEGLTKLLIRICSGEVTWQDMENGSGELDESEPKRLGILADHLGLREIESHKLRDVLECLHVSPRDRAIQIGKLLQVLESTKTGSDEDVEILKDLLQLVSRQDASIMPARAEQGRHSLGSIRDRLAHLLGVQPPSRLRVLLWEQVDQIRELQPLSAYLEKKSRAEVDQKLEALQTRCVAQPQLVLVVKELRQFVDLFRKLDARSPPLHSMAKLLSEKLPARVDRDRTKELIKLMTSAGSEDIGERGRLHLEELVSPETTLSFQMQDLGQSEDSSSRRMFVDARVVLGSDLVK
ncbi:unnamed protein product [Polarella glacialis]|uniref:Uncharacterized protein n=1 Tax=Polarella glacialis TaxID=89957 RepID=A0A813JZI0_POLGL|nr:unnamed protein product [Polarella glacialis]